MGKASSFAIFSLSGMLFALAYPATCFAQQWETVDCNRLDVRFDEGGVLIADGTTCRLQESDQGKIESIDARGGASLAVTTIWHLYNPAGEIPRSDIRDFVMAANRFSKVDGWSAPKSISGFDVLKFQGTLLVDPYWETSCITFARYSTRSGSGQTFKHQISGFSCTNPVGWRDGMNEAEIADLLSRISGGL